MGILGKFLGGAVTGIVGLGLVAWLSTKFAGDNGEETEESSDLEED